VTVAGAVDAARLAAAQALDRKDLHIRQIGAESDRSDPRSRDANAD
jgi:hypothetical protein